MCVSVFHVYGGQLIRLLFFKIWTTEEIGMAHHISFIVDNIGLKIEPGHMTSVGFLLFPLPHLASSAGLIHVAPHLLAGQPQASLVQGPMRGLALRRGALRRLESELRRFQATRDHPSFSPRDGCARGRRRMAEVYPQPF